MEADAAVKNCRKIENWWESRSSKNVFEIININFLKTKDTIGIVKIRRNFSCSFIYNSAGDLAIEMSKHRKFENFVFICANDYRTSGGAQAESS